MSNSEIVRFFKQYCRSGWIGILLADPVPDGHPGLANPDTYLFQLNVTLHITFFQKNIQYTVQNFENLTPMTLIRKIKQHNCQLCIYKSKINVSDFSACIKLRVGPGYGLASKWKGSGSVSASIRCRSTTLISS